MNEDWRRLYQSHYSAQWQGIIIAREGASDCYWYLILYDRHGNPMTRRTLKLLHEHWVRDTGEKINASTINPDWLKAFGRDRQMELQP
jgi:hypothetical protein